MKKSTMVAFSPSNIPPGMQGECCIVGISVGQNYHEGRRMAAILNYASTHFARVVILVADALKRYTLSTKNGLDPETNWQAAVALGDAWLMRHAGKLEMISVPFEIERYSTWIVSPDYKERIALIRQIYSSSDLMQDAVQRDVSNYLDRFYSRGGTTVLQESKLFQHCRDFLLEELAVCSLLSEKHGTSTECYPGTMLNCYQVFTTHNVTGAPASLNRWRYIALDFKTVDPV